MNKPRILFWHRKDLRIFDNQALIKAFSLSNAITSTYIFDKNYPHDFNSSSRAWFLGNSLQELGNNWKKMGSRLVMEEGDPVLIIPHLAKKIDAAILTTDFNLNRIATLQNILVLNINEVANSVKTVLLPGEEFTVQVVQPGKESDQGLAYLDDGTMIVVENGIQFLNTSIKIIVSRVIQTATGKIIFAKLPLN